MDEAATHDGQIQLTPKRMSNFIYPNQQRLRNGLCIYYIS